MFTVLRRGRLAKVVSNLVQTEAMQYRMIDIEVAAHRVDELYLRYWCSWSVRLRHRTTGYTTLGCHVPWHHFRLEV